MESEPSHGPTLRKNIRRHASDFPGKRQQWRSHAVFADCHLERLRGRNADRGRRRALRATKSTWRDYIGGGGPEGSLCRKKTNPRWGGPPHHPSFFLLIWFGTAFGGQGVMPVA